MHLQGRERRLALRAAMIIGEYAKCIRESEVTRGQPGRGQIDDADVRRELAEYRAVVAGLCQIAGVTLEE